MNDNRKNAGGAPAAPDNVSKLDTTASGAPALGDPTAEALAEAAAAEEQAANGDPAVKDKQDVGTYIHRLSRPIQWNDRSYEVLTFRWDALTGADHLDIENELLMRGKTLVVPEYTGDYLCGMAVRACTERNEKGLRALDAAALKTLPLKDFTTICKKARSFLMHSESLPETEDSGSGKSA